MKCAKEGTITVEMQFMADIHLQCENCKGKRYKKETLKSITGEDIHELLEMSLTEALDFLKKVRIESKKRL